MGGPSAEREISLLSGNAVLKALVDIGVDAVGFDVSDASVLSDLQQHEYKSRIYCPTWPLG